MNDQITKRDAYSPTGYNKVRVSKRAAYGCAAVHTILDSGLVAHVGLILDGRPFVLPMAYARCGETLYIHGAKAARLIKKPAESAPVCLTVTHIDALVVARSAFHHSVNYRSVVVHGALRQITSASEKEAALVAVTNHLLPGRWDEVREMKQKEFNATGVLAIDIESASAKTRSGPPVDDDADYALPVWAGTVPVSTQLGAPIPDPKLMPEAQAPASIEKAHRKFT